MDKPQPARNPLWLDHVSTLGRDLGTPRALIGWPSHSCFKLCSAASQRDLLLPRARRLTGERSAFNLTR